jgi:hypothetical protein
MSIGVFLTAQVAAQTPPASAQTKPAAQAQPPAPAQTKPAAPAQAAAPSTPPPPMHLVAKGPEFRVGVLYGRVVDIDNKPVSGATVALQDSNNRVLGWTKTDAQGEYAIAADPMTVLHLRPSRRRGLLEQCARAVGDVVTAPIKVVGSTIVNPGPTLRSAVVSVATGTPAPLAAQAAAPILGDKNIGDETGKNAREAAAKTAVGEGPNAKGKKPVAEKGETRIVVSLPNYKDAGGKAEAYWLECPCTDKDNLLGMQAWLDTVKLAPTASDKASEVTKEAVTLTAPVVDQTLVPAGGTVKIKVKLQSPLGPERPVRVFAREARKDVVVELMQQEGQDKSIYAGNLTLDPHTPAGETTVTIAALRADPVEVKLEKKKADPLIEFVRRLDDMEANKPYEYDPRIMASANRLDVKLTVLDVKQETPGARH